MSERLPHAVLLREAARFDATGVSAVLAVRRAISAESLLPVVRRGWGIVWEPSAAEEAESLAAALSAAGLPALAVPASLLETPPPAASVTKAELSGDGFDIVAGRAGAARERLSWSRLKVLSAGIAAGDGGARFIDLLFVEPLRRVRLLGSEFDYAALGDRMAYSADLNFRALAAALAARAPGALRSKGARAVLAKEPSGAMSYESFADAEGEERWLLGLATLGAAL